MIDLISGSDGIKLLCNIFNIPSVGVREVRLKANYQEATKIEVDMIASRPKSIDLNSGFINADVKYRYLYGNTSVSFDLTDFDVCINKKGGGSDF